MKRLALVALLLAMTVAPTAAQPRVRAELASSGPVLVGQQIRLSVTVLAPNYFLSAPQFPTFDMPGAIVMLLDEPGINSTETIEGVTFAGIRRSYTIMPQRTGEFVLPPARITFSYAAEPGRPGVAATVTLPPQPFTVRLPAGAAAGATTVVARLTITQTLDGDPRRLKAGEALTRTIEIFAANTQAMMIPPPEFEAPAGVRLYRHDPTVADVTTDRGSFAGGRRVDRVTYVFERPGSVMLPAIDVDWLNTETGRREVATAPAIDVLVAETPAARTEIAPPPPPDIAANHSARGSWLRGLARLLAILALALVFFGIVVRFGARLRAWARALQQASEPASFKRLKRACLADDPAKAYRALGAWARRQGVSGVRALCASEPALRDETADLERRLFGRPPLGAWSGRALLRSSTAVRRARRTARRRKGRLPRLPELNPWGGATTERVANGANSGLRTSG